MRKAHKTAGQVKIEQVKQEILQKVMDYHSTKEGEYRSHASDALVIIRLLYEYVFVHDRERYMNRLNIHADSLLEFDEYGLLLVKTSPRILENFCPEKGDFFAYFETSFFRALKEKVGEDISFLKHGMRTPYGESVRTISRIIRESSHDIEDAEVVRIASEEYDITVTELDVIDFRNGIVSLDEPIKTEDGTTEIKDLIPDPNYVNPEKELLLEEHRQKVVNYIEEAFLKTQERQRGYLSAVLTARCSEWIFSNHNLLFPLVSDMEWFDDTVYQFYVDKGKAKEQKMIAEEYKMAESSISRAVTDFLKNYMDRADLEEILGIVNS